MQQLLTGKKRLPGFVGAQTTLHLSEIVKITMGSSPKSSAYNQIGDGLPLLQGNADISNRQSSPRIYTSEVTKECQIGDILLSVRAPVGTVARSIHKACIGRGIASLRSKESSDIEFIYQYMLFMEPKWASLSQGSTFESVNSDDIKRLEVLVPSLEEQRAIAAVLVTADEEIEALEQRINNLKLQKKALMQQLLTGKKRVKIESVTA